MPGGPVRAPRLLSALAVPVLLLAACGDADEAGDDVGDEQPEELDDEEASELEEGMPGEDELSDVPVAQVTLLDAGDDPQAPLRLSLEEGDEMAVTMSISSEQSAERVDDEQAPISQTIDLDLVVSEVADGRAVVDFEFTDASIGGLPEGQPDQSEQLVGLTGQMVLDERARVTAATQTAQGLDEVLIPFPEEDVGPGATWEVVTESTPEFPVTETLSVELVAFDGEAYELALEVASDELEEPVEQEGLQGQPMTIEDLVVAGEGEVRGALTDLFPTAASLVSEQSVVLDLGEEAGGQQSQQTRSELTLEER
jgi:hypothetical protein